MSAPVPPPPDDQQPGTLSVSQFVFVNNVTHVMAVCGFVGSVATIIAYLRIKFFDIPMGRIIFFLSLGYLVEAVCKFVGPWAVEAGHNSAFCNYQGATLEAADLFTVSWMFFIGLGLMLVMLGGWTSEQVKRLDIPFFFASLVVSIGVAVPWLFWNDPRGPMYDTVAVWCWISKAYPVMQIALLHGPVLVVLLLDIIIFVAIGIKIRNKSRSLNVADELKHKIMMMYIYTAATYIIVFMLSWLPGFLCRYAHIVEGHGYFVPILLRSILTPLRGLINFILFFILALMASKQKAMVKKG